MKEGKADNEHSNPVLLPLPLNSQHLHFSFTVVHFQKFLLEVVAIGRKNAGWESDILTLQFFENQKILSASTVIFGTHIERKIQGIFILARQKRLGNFLKVYLY
jgi:hypothetical protein